jgi:hypothetical protein
MDNLKQAMTENIPLHWETCSMEDGKYYEIHAYPFAQGLSVFLRILRKSSSKKANC